MNISSYVNSFFNSVSYRFENVLVDAGDEWGGFHDVEALLLTHAHFDHIYGINKLLELNPNVKIYTNTFGFKGLMDTKINLSKYHNSPFILSQPENVVIVSDGDVVKLSETITVKAIFTPGHNRGCITWVVGDMLFTGDAYIPGLKTVTNLPGGDRAAAKESEQLIWKLAEGRHVLPGHNVLFLRK